MLKTKDSEIRVPVLSRLSRDFAQASEILGQVRNSVRRPNFLPAHARSSGHTPYRSCFRLFGPTWVTPSGGLLIECKEPARLREAVLTRCQRSVRKTDVAFILPHISSLFQVFFPVDMASFQPVSDPCRYHLR
jgi:hypothetical protein